MAIDAALSRLFNGLKTRLPGGLAHTAFVLTGDHGIPPDPGYLHAHRIPTGYIDYKALEQVMERHLAHRFGPVSPLRWIAHNHRLGFSLNGSVLTRRRVKLTTVLAAMTKKLLSTPEIAHVFTIEDADKRRYPPGKWGRQTRNSYYRARSPDLLLIPAPFILPKGDRITHVSGYNYDTTVPLAFKGRFFRRAVHARKPEITSIAPTLALLLGIVPPALSEGKLLHEAFTRPPAKRPSPPKKLQRKSRGR